MAEHQNVLFEISQGVATITLNRPEKLNALTMDMLHQLALLIAKCAEHDDVRAVILTGVGRGFSAGQDLAAVQGNQPVNFEQVVREGYNPVVQGIAACPKPVIAAVNGVAAGAGANLALACDLLVAAESAVFIQAFTAIGLMPDSGGTWFLPRIFGLHKAKELAFLGERLTAAEAKQWGMVARIFTHENFAAESFQFAHQIATLPTAALAMTKAAMHQALSLPLAEALDAEAKWQGKAGLTTDHAEGVAAFLEKRKPHFQGK
ncbi:2-(1,2-epoxy-1,2-dihydrophenyl)acetyl-CoA isomerase [Alicyclobacillus sp. TC]|uniref:enoyl-CoA hydratase-related protein n=1 Tax=Alicyclobacillus sp. TC TaxID=2606450 RepID=UPI00193242D8|nr:enoyl-CoA hydratase-related protein [Alicyclobacillus sp. TC]QRF24079.1 2-(1,2-epoxy-1,2-dihydrophenyl)acetyl-CoA isomerase [Alicyclobacillus sp. TC]